MNKVIFTAILSGLILLILKHSFDFKVVINSLMIIIFAINILFNMPKFQYSCSKKIYLFTISNLTLLSILWIYQSGVMNGLKYYADMQLENINTLKVAEQNFYNNKYTLPEYIYNQNNSLLKDLNELESKANHFKRKTSSNLSFSNYKMYLMQLDNLNYKIQDRKNRLVSLYESYFFGDLTYDKSYQSILKMPGIKSTFKYKVMQYEFIGQNSFLYFLSTLGISVLKILVVLVFAVIAFYEKEIKRHFSLNHSFEK